MAKKHANGEGDVCERRQWRMKRAKRSGSRADEYTVATWLRSWYDIYAKSNVRVATADRYHLMIEQYTIPHIGSIKLTKLAAHDLQKLYKELMESGRTNRKSRTKPHRPWAASWRR